MKDFIIGVLVLGVLVLYLLPSTDETKRDQALKDVRSQIEATIWVKKEVKISKKDINDTWAFSAESVTLGCDRYPLIYVVDYDNMGVKYGLNGKSKRHYAELKRDNPFWLKEPNQNCNISLQPFIDKALELCNNKKIDQKLKELKEKEAKLEAMTF
jgi:hypothetical protein